LLAAMAAFAVALWVMVRAHAGATVRRCAAWYSFWLLLPSARSRIHQMDALLNSFTDGGVRVNWLLERTGPGLIFLAAIKLLLAI
jgi:hypothetical protein